MSHKIPNEEEILCSIEKVLKKVRIIHSQQKFRELVQNELIKINDKYRITGKRLRLLALRTNLIKVEIHTRESEKKHGISKCPVCSAPLKFIKNKTIFNGIVTLGHKCTFCPYWTGVKRRIPIRYIFSWKSKV